MSPTERAVQSRIKEAFAFKISTAEWEHYIEIIANGTSNDDAYQNRPKHQLHYAKKQAPGGKQAPKNLMFKVKEIVEDPAIGQMTRAIYLQDQGEWTGIDQNTSELDEELYGELKDFLEEYFCSPEIDAAAHQNEDEKWCSSLENGLTRSSYQPPRYHSTVLGGGTGPQGNYEQEFEEVRAIPGGRYGCA